MQTKKEEMRAEAEEIVETEERSVPGQKRSYWEFGLFIVIALTMVAVVGVLGFLLVKTFSKQDDGEASIQTIAREVTEEKKTQSNTEIKEKTEEVKAPVVKEIVPAEVAIKILNGGAVGGSAGKVKEALVAKGYKKIEVGNSEKSNYVGVTVFYQAEMKTAAEKIVTDLKTKYPSAQAKLGVSVEEKSGPVVVILGK